MDNGSPITEEGKHVSHKHRQPEVTSQQLERNELHDDDVVAETSCPPYGWDPINHGKNIVVSREKPNTARRKIASQWTDGVRGTCGFSYGRHVFEISFGHHELGSHCCVGICKSDSTMQLRGYCQLFGMKDDSWAWDLPTGSLLHDGMLVGFLHCNVDAKPLTIRLFLDNENGTMSFDRGDGLRHLAFSDINAGDSKKKKKELYPAASLVFGQAEVTINLLSSTTVGAQLTLDDITQDIVTTVFMDTNIEEIPSKPKKQYSESLVDNISIEYIRKPPVERLKLEFNDACHGGEQRHVLPPASVKLQSFDSLHDQRMFDCVQRKIPVAHDTGTSLQTTANKENMQRIFLADVDSGEEAEAVTELANMMEEDGYLLRMSHGWDSVKRGGLLHNYPGLPYICVPSLRFSERVQAIRCREGFKRGKHRWLIRDLKVYTPKVGREDMSFSQNNLIIGAVSEEHRTFNYGYSMKGIGDHAWGWQPSRDLTWNGKQRLDNDFDESDSETVKESVEIKVSLSVRLGTLTFHRGHDHLATIQGLKGKEFFPCIWFYKKALFPVEIQYLEGPTVYIQERLSVVRNLRSYLKDDFLTTKYITTYTSLSLPPVLADKHNIYKWGRHSENIHLESKTHIWMEANMPDNQWALAQKMIYGGTHDIDFFCDRSNSLVFGLVRMRSDTIENEDDEESQASLEALGRDTESWGWDVSERTLHHAGMLLGRFPSDLKKLDVTTLERFRLTIHFDQTSGENTASFSCMTEDGGVQPMGIAFVNLPQRVRPAVIIKRGSHVVNLTMEYHSGPESYIHELQPPSSSCAIL